MLIQLPVFVGLYYVVRKFAEGAIPHEWLYSFFWSFGKGFSSGEGIDAYFLGMNLFENHNVVLTAIVAVLNFTQFSTYKFDSKGKQACCYARRSSDARYGKYDDDNEYYDDAYDGKYCV